MRKLTTYEGCIEIIIDYNIRVHHTNLNGECRGFTRGYPEGYIIFVEATLCIEAIKRTIQHELCHIILGHLDDEETTEEEKEAEVIEVLSNLRKEKRNVR